MATQSIYESMSWDAETGRRLHSLEQSDHRLSGSMHITHEGWIVYSVTSRTLGKLPTMLAGAKYAARERSLALRTNSGHVFVLCIPPALLTTRRLVLLTGRSGRDMRMLCYTWWMTCQRMIGFGQVDQKC